VRILRLVVEILVIAYNRFVLHDAWAIASHIALSILMSMFPFLILITGVASFFGSGSLADEAADIILEAWPSEVAKPIADEVHNVLTVRREGILTVGLLLALYFASSGVEALRVGLNRAYGLRETRAWWFTRLESIAFVIGGAFVMLAFAVLVVFGPLAWRGALYWLPGLQPFDGLIAFLRIGVATVLIVVALVLATSSSRPGGGISAPSCRGWAPRSCSGSSAASASGGISRTTRRLRLHLRGPGHRHGGPGLPLYARRHLPLWGRTQRNRDRGEEAEAAQALRRAAFRERGPGTVGRRALALSRAPQR
jgi:hypothetical protein